MSAPLLTILDALAVQLETQHRETQRLGETNASLTAQLSSALRKIDALEFAAESSRQQEAAFMRAVATTSQVVSQKADSDVAYLETTAKLEEQLRRSQASVHEVESARAAATSTAERLAKELVASQAANAAQSEKMVVSTEKMKTLQSECDSAGGRLLSLQHRLDDSTFGVQQLSERIASADAAAAAAQKGLDVLQKKHSALLVAIASETSLKRKREQGSVGDHAALHSAAVGEAEPQRRTLPMTGNSGGRGGGSGKLQAVPVAPSSLPAAQSARAGLVGRSGGGDAMLPTARSSGGAGGLIGGPARKHVDPPASHSAVRPALQDSIIDLSPLDDHDDSPVSTLKRPRSRYVAH